MIWIFEEHVFCVVWAQFTSPFSTLLLQSEPSSPPFNKTVWLFLLSAFKFLNVATHLLIVSPAKQRTPYASVSLHNLSTYLFLHLLDASASEPGWQGGWVLNPNAMELSNFSVCPKPLLIYLLNDVLILRSSFLIFLGMFACFHWFSKDRCTKSVRPRSNRFDAIPIDEPLVEQSWPQIRLFQWWCIRLFVPEYFPKL